MTTTTIRLSQTAPWNNRLRNPYRTRYAEAGGRYFRVEADSLTAPWFVYEIDRDGRIADYDVALVALVWNLPAAREAIRLRVAGKATDEISAATGSIRAGTGRSHPRNVARRAAGRTGRI